MLRLSLLYPSGRFALLNRRQSFTFGRKVYYSTMNNTRFTEASGENEDLKKGDGFTSDMAFVQRMEPFKSYQVMDHEGRVLDKNHEPKVSKEFAVNIYKKMAQMCVMDGILHEVQRQGRISFYMTHYGEEATIASAAALNPDDMIYGQYRESYMLLYRGFTIDEFVNQCFSNHLDYGKGRQMPIHYGSKKLSFQTISSCIANQIPQAPGAAYAFKLSGQDRCSFCFFGEGAASEGDFHAALTMAAVLECPTIFFCRNNGFAISTPASEQYKGDGIASRGVGYGIDTIRVDGNDVWAVYNATKAAREIAVNEKRPVLIESITYRFSHHSTSDDSSKYRDVNEMEELFEFNNPILRFRRYLEEKQWWDQEQEDAWLTQVKRSVLKSIATAEKRKKPSIDHLFNDVYDEMPYNLIKQRQELARLIKEYPDYYSTDSFVPSS